MTTSSINLARVAVVVVAVALPSVAALAQQNARSTKEVALGLARSGKVVGLVLSSSDFDAVERVARAGSPEPVAHDDLSVHRARVYRRPSSRLTGLYSLR